MQILASPAPDAVLPKPWPLVKEVLDKARWPQRRIGTPQVLARGTGTTGKRSNAAPVRGAAKVELAIQISIQEALGFFTVHFATPYPELSRLLAAGVDEPG